MAKKSYPRSYSSTVRDYKGRIISYTNSTTSFGHTSSTTQRYFYRPFTRLEKTSTLNAGVTIFHIVFLILILIAVSSLLVQGTITIPTFKSFFTFITDFPQVDLSWIGSWSSASYNGSGGFLLDLLGGWWNIILKSVQFISFLLGLLFNAVGFIINIVSYIFLGGII